MDYLTLWGQAVPNWLQVFLLLATTLLGIWLAWSGRKKLLLEYRVEAYPNSDRYYLRATNTSTNRGIEILNCGLVYWDGKVHKDYSYYAQDDYRLQPEQYREFYFQDKKTGDWLRYNIKDVYYFYVKDAGGKYYYRYISSRWIAWLKRFFTWYFSFLGL